MSDDASLAAQLAEAAGALLLDLHRCGSLPSADLGKAGDRAANALLVDAIRAARPADGLLSEEAQDNAERLGHRRVWIIDPVDGTREYSEGRSDWAVHVGLAVDGLASAGAVALPGLGQVFRSDQPAAVPPPSTPLRMVVSRTRPAAEAVSVAEHLGAQLVPMGSAGAKAMAIIRGEADIYLHSGGQFEWDSCAPVAVAQAHGLHCSRIDGSPLRYNQHDTYVPDLLICRPDHAQLVLETLRMIQTAPTSSSE